MKEALLTAADASLRTLLAPHLASRSCATVPESTHTTPELTSEQQALSGALMRVNHVGEVCAQALYTSQALGARLFFADEPLAKHMEMAGHEETDHLAWTEERLQALGSRPSLLNPVWYAGAFAIGLLASRMGSAASLGFVVETERQVEAHLRSHTDRLPENDTASHAVVAQMRDDEGRHALEAQAAGAKPLPRPVRWAMKAAGKVMTTVAHRV